MTAGNHSLKIQGWCGLTEILWQKLKYQAQNSITAKVLKYFGCLWEKSALHSLFNGNWAAASVSFRKLGEAFAKLEDLVNRRRRVPDTLFARGIFPPETLLIAIALVLPFIRFRFLIGLVALAAFLLLLQRKEDLQWVRSPIFIPVVLFAGVQLFAALTSVLPGASAGDFLVSATAFVYLLLLTGAVNRREQLDNLLAVLGVSAFLVSGYAIYYYYAGTPVSELGKVWVDPATNPGIENRAYAVFENPNLLAHYLVLTFPLLLAAFANAQRLLERVFFLACAGLNVYCLLLTYSRGGWLGFAAAVFVFAMVRNRFLLLALPFAVPVGYFALPAAAIRRLENITNLSDASNIYRFSVWNSTLDLIRDFWPYGAGLGWQAFLRVYYAYARSFTNVIHAHNLYLQLLAELGIFGLAAFAWLFVSLARAALRLSASGSAYIKNLNAGVSGALAGFFVHSLVDYTLWYHSLTVLFWILVALMILLEKFNSGGNNSLEVEV